ncbi:MAG: Trm112 family protein [Deltaproteobacteria bacterium]
MAVSEALLALLVCPKCRGKLVHDAERRELRCGACRLAYRIEDDIPVMLLDEARPT